MKLKTIEDITQKDFLDPYCFNEMVEIIKNTLLKYGEINKEYEFTIGDYIGEATLEFCCVDDISEALDKGWIQIKAGPSLEINIWEAEGGLYYVNDYLWSDIYDFLESLISEAKHE